MANTQILSQAALGVILLSIQTTLAPTAFAQSATRTSGRIQRVETTSTENQNSDRQLPTTNGTFAAPIDITGIECQRLGSGVFLCGCGTTSAGECHDTFRAECGHVEPGQALCDEDISDE